MVAAVAIGCLIAVVTNVPVVVTMVAWVQWFLWLHECARSVLLYVHFVSC